MNGTDVKRWGVLPSSTTRLEEAYRAHATDALRLAYTLTGDRQAAEDLVQEAFLRLGRKVLGLSDLDHARGYLFRTVINLARGRGRKLTRERAAFARIPRSEGAQAEPSHGDLWTTLERLPSRQRAALFLRYYLDLSEVEAAEVLGCSQAALKSLVTRGLRTLRQSGEGEHHG